LVDEGKVLIIHVVEKINGKAAYYSVPQMILSSDKLSGLGKPVVQLKLDTSSAGESSVLQEHLLELDLKEITALLKVLKNAQTVRVHMEFRDAAIA
jgi:hypothetical protein